MAEANPLVCIAPPLMELHVGMIDFLQIPLSFYHWNRSRLEFTAPNAFKGLLSLLLGLLILRILVFSLTPLLDIQLLKLWFYKVFPFHSPLFLIAIRRCSSSSHVHTPSCVPLVCPRWFLCTRCTCFFLFSMMLPSDSWNVAALMKPCMRGKQPYRPSFIFRPRFFNSVSLSESPWS